MIFTDRRQAGILLAEKLVDRRIVADIVVGLAHGGVAVAVVIAQTLHIPCMALTVKKIGSPGNPELAAGAFVPEGQDVDVRGKRIMLVDDGIATGETMKAAVAWARDRGAQKIIVAVPVAPAGIDIPADEVIYLEIPEDFGAVGEFYKSFPQLTDADVVKLLA